MSPPQLTPGARWRLLIRCKRTQPVVVEFLLTPGLGPLTLGRGEACHFLLRANTVGRQHLRFEGGDEGWTVEDLGSSSGIWLDGVRPTAGQSLLRVGVTLSFGSFEAELIDELGFRKTPSRMGLLLVQSAGKPADQFAPLNPAEDARIGRSKSCALISADEKIPRQNGIVRWLGDAYEYEDFNSNNGSFFAGARIEKRRLEPIDLIAFGGSAFVFVPTGELAKVRELAAKKHAQGRPWWNGMP